MTIRAIIEKAGRFPVIQTPVPFFRGEMSDLSAPRAGVLHTTEGPWNASMDVFRVHYAPHFMLGINPQGRAAITQLVPVGTIGAACKAHNASALVEIEMVAYCKETPWLPDAETLDALASLMIVCRDEWGIPLSRPWIDGDYGRAGHNPHRSSGKFGHVAGWFGHADMPDPDTHWDPGNLIWSTVFTRANTLDAFALNGSTPAATNSGSLPPVPNPLQGLTVDLTPSDLQTALNTAGMRPLLVVDGDIGSKTTSAITRFQSVHGLFADGKPNAKTITALRDIVAKL